MQRNKKKNLFYPDAYVRDVFSIDFHKLFSMGYRGVIFDIDGTLACQDADAPLEIYKFLRKVEKVGFKIVFCSNNTSERIEGFLGDLDLPFVSEARKPRTGCYKEAFEKMKGIPKRRIVCVGDQIFTDVLSANMVGLKTILVEYMHDADDGYCIGKRRWLEGVVLKKYKKKRCLGGLGEPTKRKIDNNPEIVGRNFSNINSMCYSISHNIRVIKRLVNDLRDRNEFAKMKSTRKMPVLVSQNVTKIVKNGKGKEFARLQKNKAVNIRIASRKINKVIIYPGEVFSFWNTIGSISKKKHYKEGRVIVGGKIRPGIGGGLCRLGHAIDWTVLHSPLDVVELHRHSDSLNPEPKKRKSSV